MPTVRTLRPLAEEVCDGGDDQNRPRSPCGRCACRVDDPRVLRRHLFNALELAEAELNMVYGARTSALRTV